MTSQSVNPVASPAFTQGESTVKEAKNQTVNNKKKKKGIGIATGWLRIVEPRKLPYFPQIKDKIVYLRQAHECYLKEVKERKIFDVKESDKLWVEMKMDNDIEYLIVVNISFEKHPARVARLEVKKINREENAFGPIYELRYHDMGDIADFLVLKHIFNEGLQKKWNAEDRLRCLVGNKWFFGTIKSIEPFNKKYPKSPFNSLKIKWDDDKELDEVSPWEVQNLNKNRLPKNHGEPVEVLNIEIVKMRYKPVLDDWPDWEAWKANMKKMVSEFDYLINKLGISKCFIEIKNDPVYDALVLYPIDLSTIRERIDKYFYRRFDALLMDIFYLKENAKQHKPEKLATKAILIAEVCEEIINKGGCDSSSFSKLKDFLTNFNSSESEDDDNEYNPSGSSNKKGFNSNSKNCWKKGCEELLTTLWKSEDILAFRQPVCREDYPDYYKVISSPICLEEINKKFYLDQYESPKDFFGDIKLLITNSRKYNTDKTKAIYHATGRFSALFDELKKQINCKKDTTKSKFNKNHQKKDELDELITVKCRRTQKHSLTEATSVIIPCNSAENVAQQKESTDKKNSDNESVVEEKLTDSKNNDFKKDLTKSVSFKNSETNHKVETSNVTVAIQDEGKEDEKSEKINVQENLVQFMELGNSNNSTKRLPHEMESLNEDFRMETDEDPKSLQISQSQRSESMESIIVIDSDNDDEKESHNFIGSVEKTKNCNQTQLHGAENRVEDINNSRHKKSNVKNSFASSKAKKHMQLQFNRIFRRRPCKSCVTCQNIKLIYLDHLKSHKF